MSVLRIYKPDECSADGIPLDWNRCRGLDELDGGMGSLHEAMRQRGEDCPSCGGHESLKAAVLAELIGTRRYRVYDSYHGEFMDISEPVENPIARCSSCSHKSCSHKMSEGTWEGPWKAREVLGYIRVGMVAKRTLGDRFDPGNVLQVRPFDLTRENVSVMCLRCWAAPT